MIEYEKIFFRPTGWVGDEAGTGEMLRQPASWATGSSFLAAGVACGLFLVAAASVAGGGLRIHSDYGPENALRPKRLATRYIVLHTTEGREAGSLRKLRQRGEAHYFVHRDGRVTRLIDRHRIATHAGLSIWRGRRDIDEVSLGIEVSGYHDEEPTPAQYKALRELLRQLQSLYDLPDDHVLTHSMVAYGAPNRFHPYAHRGRKRCAMVFADPGVRGRLGLTSAPVRDPDVAAGRVRPGDRELQRHLYPHPSRARVEEASRVVATAGVITSRRTAWAIAGEAYASPTTTYVFPDGTRIRGDEVGDWGDIPRGTRVLLDQIPARAKETDAVPPADVDGLLVVGHPVAARDLLGGAAKSDTTTYLFPSGAVQCGAQLERSAEGRKLLQRLPAGTKVLVGYVSGGRVARGRSLVQTAGSRWNDPRTYYRTPSGKVRSGVEIDRHRVVPGTLVFLRQ
jgi:hypothetical protein